MVQDNPKQEELHEMIKFIAQNKQIYIYIWVTLFWLKT